MPANFMGEEESRDFISSGRRFIRNMFGTLQLLSGGPALDSFGEGDKGIFGGGDKLMAHEP